MKSISRFFAMGIFALLISWSGMAYANNCVLRSWTSPALPAAQTGMPNGNCSEIAASTRAACEAWCDSKIATIQSQVSETGPVQYPLFCVWDGTYINGCNHPNAGAAITMNDKVYTAPAKCSGEIKLDDIQAAAAERSTFSELGLPPDMLAIKVMERAAIAWARNCRTEINNGYSSGLLFWHYYLSLIATKSQNGAISLAVKGNQTFDSNWTPSNFVIKANGEIFTAAGGVATNPAYLACNAVRTASNGATQSEIQLCKQTPEIDAIFDLASSRRQELSASTSPATHLASTPSIAFPAYQRKLLYDLTMGAPADAPQRLNFGLFKNWATQDQSSTKCIFDRAAQSYNLTGCSFVRSQ